MSCQDLIDNNGLCAVIATGATCANDTDCAQGQTCQNIVNGSGTCGTTTGLASSPNCPPGTPAGTVCLANPIRVTTLPEFVNNVISIAVGMVGALALLVFVSGGLRWLTSSGEPAKIQAGKDAMKWAAIGLVIVFTSYALVNFIFQALTGQA